MDKPKKFIIELDVAQRAELRDIAGALKLARVIKGDPHSGGKVANLIIKFDYAVVELVDLQ